MELKKPLYHRNSALLSTGAAKLGLTVAVLVAICELVLIIANIA